MFDWIKDFIYRLWDYIVPFKVIYVYERGVRLRFGKNPILVNPGFKLKIPFIDEIHSCNVENETKEVKPIHITTIDDKTIVVTPVIKYKIIDPIKYIIEANDANSNLHDITRGVTADYMTDIDWVDCKKKTTLTKIKHKLNEKIEDIGVIVTDVMLTDLCISKILITKI